MVKEKMTHTSRYYTFLIEGFQMLLTKIAGGVPPRAIDFT